METKDITGLGVVSIKSLDDPDGPYYKQYQEWDRWIYDNIVIEPLAFESGDRPTGFEVLKVRVTNSGYLLPYTEKIRLMNEQDAKEYDNHQSGIEAEAPYSVQAAGIMTTDMKERLELAVNRVIGEFYMPVPNWLAENPPIWAMLVPNGDIVTFGPLGSSNNTGNQAGCCGNNGKESYFRYNAAGELLRSSPNWWWDLYFDTVKYDDPPGVMHNRHDGYFYFTDPDSDEILSVWDWNAEPLNTTILPPVRDIHPFTSLRAGQLKKIHIGQQADSIS